MQVQRINRCPRGERRARPNLGDYYVIDTRRNLVGTTDADPEALGRRLGVLQPWESVIEEDHF